MVLSNLFKIYTGYFAVTSYGNVLAILLSQVSAQANLIDLVSQPGSVSGSAPGSVSGSGLVIGFMAWITCTTFKVLQMGTAFILSTTYSVD